MTDRNNRQREFTYDGLNRQTKEKWLDATGNSIRTINSSYNVASQLIAVSDPDSSYNFNVSSMERDCEKIAFCWAIAIHKKYHLL